MQKKWPISDDFGLRSVLSHSESISEEKCYLYRSMRQIQEPHIDRQDPQHNVRALRRPPAKATSLREPYVRRTTTERLAHRVMFRDDGWCGDNPGPGRPKNNTAQSLADDIKAFKATVGSTDNPPFAVRSKECAMVEGG